LGPKPFTRAQSEPASKKHQQNDLGIGEFMMPADFCKLR
jgi:hypothetical protein